MNARTSQGGPSDRQHALTQTIIDAGGVIRSAPAGATSFRWQGPPRAFVFVQTGKLSVQFRTKDRQVPWAECRAGSGQDCMPVTAAILSERPISVRAICMVPSTWIELSPMALVLMVHEQPEFRHALFAGHARRLPAFFARLSTNKGRRLDQRIADWLLSHAHANEVRATHSEIATDLLTAREVVSRKLKDFATKGWIAQQRGCILIKAPAALSRVSRGVFPMCRPVAISA
ncbi:Crp/Fnr family transcriptional regulator [Rhodobacteraceae bacterium N5(2021)]|uniref:Crp/Fnr family transcriptional regulator n=1 Tax=Gymnodinialimonas phycosphaerae TaxID=2841589 RepID=A0A975YHT9_9RHOB|nr:Crp/Fnr family transcriptional regulator [Gymnodinialimonas phycosphaerae]MBY4893022.1 Crp/Fnr family transcriptional regulator [Gymnodinialimonas phycosphaerae]